MGNKAVHFYNMRNSFSVVWPATRF